MRVRCAVLAALAALPLGAQERPFHFRYDVQPWLSRQGCAAAECHGGALGRGGFKLSLFGGEPDADYRALVVDRDGRRLDLRDPDRSLVLRKPTLDLDHGGGIKLVRDGTAWTALRAWIANDAPFTRGDAARIERLSLALDGDRLRAAARFTWTDEDSGVERSIDEDVSDRALFATTAPDVVDVARRGHVERKAQGDAALTARFAGRDASLRVSASFGEPVEVRSDAAPVDRAWLSGLSELGLAPGGAAPADVMARRLYLDLAGRLPTPAERRAFLDLLPDERVPATVDALLATDDFTAVVAAWLARWFEVGDGSLRTLAGDGSLLDAVAARVDRPPIARAPDPRDRAELFGRAVLGVRLGCARCHDHPLDRWRRDDHVGFAALFTDARPAAHGGMEAGVLFDPVTGEPAVPRMLPLLGADPGPGVASADRLRAALKDDPRAFARNVANRVVAELLGRGLVEPVDDHRPTNPGVHPELLAALAATFAADGFRLRPLVRAVATSMLYARTTTPADDPLDGARVRYLARREARAMPEALLRAAVARALAVPPMGAAEPAASPLSLWLSLWNGADLQAVLDADGSALDLLADVVPDDGARLDSLFELLLTRAPTDAERARLSPGLRQSADPRRTLRALAHAIVLSREFTSIR